MRGYPPTATWLHLLFSNIASLKSQTFKIRTTSEMVSQPENIFFFLEFQNSCFWFFPGNERAHCFNRLQSDDATAPSVLASLCPFNFFFFEPSVAFSHILPLLLFVVHISTISLLLLTQPPFGPTLKMSLNADSLLSQIQRMWLRIHLVLGTSLSHTFSSCKIRVFLTSVSLILVSHRVSMIHLRLCYID